MKNLTVGLLAGMLAWAPGSVLSQQQSPNPNNSAQNDQDVPHQQPGTNNPDLQQKKKPAPNSAPKQGSGANNPSQNNSDVPHQGPGTNNPDVANKRNNSSTDTSNNQQRGAKKKQKRKQSNSATGQTQSSPQT
jgi:hypothetical protein